MNITDFICGLAAGWSQIIVGQPLDFIKTKYQMSLKHSNFFNFAKQIYTEHGLKGFYRGASSLFFGVSFTVAIQFTLYEACKKYIKKNYYPQSSQFPQDILKIWQIGVSGIFVGFCVSFIYCPIQYAKIIRQTQGKMQKSSLGLSPTLIRQVIGGIVYYSIYEQTVRFICQLYGKKRKFAQYKDFLIGGGISGLSFWMLMYPWDVIKTRVQAGKNYKQALQNILQTGYRGFGTVAIRSFLANAVGFATFQQLKGTINLIKQTSKY